MGTRATEQTERVHPGVSLTNSPGGVAQGEWGTWRRQRHLQDVNPQTCVSARAESECKEDPPLGHLCASLFGRHAVFLFVVFCLFVSFFVSLFVSLLLRNLEFFCYENSEFQRGALTSLNIPSIFKRVLLGPLLKRDHMEFAEMKTKTKKTKERF